MTAYPTPDQQPIFRPYQPGVSLTNPSFYAAHPTSAPAYDNTPIYDTRVSVPMMRTISHTHGIHSATEHTASTRYSPSPQSAAFDRLNPPPTATAPGAYALQQPGQQLNYADADRKHIDTSLLAFNGYNMARSVSGGSGSSAEVDSNGRLVTPSFDYRSTGYMTTEQELRKVSDNLGRDPRYNYHSYDPATGAHLQHGMGSYNRGYQQPEHFGFVEHDDKVSTNTAYERERQAQIMQNRKLMGELGLEQPPAPRSRSSSHATPKPRSKKRLYDSPVRTSSRITSRTVSYAHMDDNASADESEGEDEFEPDVDDDDEDFRPSKKAKGAKRSVARQVSYSAPKAKGGPKPTLSLYGLLETYDQIPHLYPLFYYTLNNDLTINGDSVPLIGTIPSTSTPIEKADTLQSYFHRGRRVLAQLDAFTARCDRKYEGPDARWPEMTYHVRIAVRDVRRKIVERCENYKYTRRDILDKVLGKNKWQPIEHGMIEWHAGMQQNDPAGDLAHVTLTLPTPPPGYHAPGYPGRAIKPMPSRAALRAGTDAYGHAVYSAYEPAPPMYGEDAVPMSVQMPPVSASSMALPSAHSAPPVSALPTASATPVPEAVWEELE
ncbi:hypothetical protein Q5752_004826 [Cryptotrichosporon argae]